MVQQTEQTQQTIKRSRGFWLLAGGLTAVVFFALTFSLVLGTIRYQFAPQPQAVIVRQLPYALDVEVNTMLAEGVVRYQRINLADVLLSERLSQSGREQTQIVLVLAQGRAALSLSNAAGPYRLQWHNLATMSKTEPP